MPKEPKEPKVLDATITSDGCVIVQMNQKIYPHTKDILFTPQVLIDLAETYGIIMPRDNNDFPGVPVVDSDAVFAEDPNDKSGEGD